MGHPVLWREGQTVPVVEMSREKTIKGIKFYEVILGNQLELIVVLININVSVRNRGLRGKSIKL